MHIDKFRYLVIEPTLLHLAKYNKKLCTKDSIDLLHGTVLLEGCKDNDVYYNQQYPSRIAKSPFQVEDATMKDNIHSYLAFRPDFLELVHELMIGKDYEENLYCNPFFACAMARIKYWRSPEAIPDHAKGKAALYKNVYNSANGKANIEKAIAVFKKIS